MTALALSAVFAMAASLGGITSNRAGAAPALMATPLALGTAATLLALFVVLPARTPPRG